MKVQKGTEEERESGRTATQKWVVVSRGPNTAAVAWLLWKLVRTADSSITYVVHAVRYSKNSKKTFGHETDLESTAETHYLFLSTTVKAQKAQAPSANTFTSNQFYSLGTATEGRIWAILFGFCLTTKNAFTYLLQTRLVHDRRNYPLYKTGFLAAKVNRLL